MLEEGRFEQASCIIGGTETKASVDRTIEPRLRSPAEVRERARAAYVFARALFNYPQLDIID